MDSFVLAIAWKTVWWPAAVGGTAALVQLTRMVAPMLPPVVLPLYSVGVGMGLSYLSQALGVDLPADPTLAGAAVGALASSGVKTLKEAKTASR